MSAATNFCFIFCYSMTKGYGQEDRTFIHKNDSHSAGRELLGVDRGKSGFSSAGVMWTQWTARCESLFAVNAFRSVMIPKGHQDWS